MKVMIQLLTLVVTLFLFEGFLLAMSNDGNNARLDFTQELFALNLSSALGEVTATQEVPVVTMNISQISEEENREKASKKRKITDGECNFTLATTPMQPMYSVNFLPRIYDLMALKEHLFYCELSLDTLNRANILGSPYTTRLRVIAGRDRHITQVDIELIGQHFPNLRELDLSRTFLNDEILGVVAEQTFAPHLTTLIISWNKQISAYGIMTYLNRFRSLKYLDISGTILIGNFGLAELGEQPWISNLVQLSIARANLTPDAMIYISEKFMNLTSLDISGNLIGDEGLEILASQPFACNLWLVARGVDASKEWIEQNKHRFKELTY